MISIKIAPSFATTVTAIAEASPLSATSAGPSFPCRAAAPTNGSRVQESLAHRVFAPTIPKSKLTASWSSAVSSSENLLGEATVSDDNSKVDGAPPNCSADVAEAIVREHAPLVNAAVALCKLAGIGTEAPAAATSALVSTAELLHDAAGAYAAPARTCQKRTHDQAALYSPGKPTVDSSILRLAKRMKVSVVAPGQSSGLAGASSSLKRALAYEF